MGLTSEAGALRAERRDSSWEMKVRHKHYTKRHKHLMHTLSSGVMGLSVLAINALIKKNESEGRKSRIKYIERQMCDNPAAI